MFDKGDTVECINIKGLTPGILKLGQTYTVDQVRGCLVSLVGVCWGVSLNGFFETRFKKKLRTDITVFTSMLNRTPDLVA